MSTTAVSDAIRPSRSFQPSGRLRRAPRELTPGLAGVGLSPAEFDAAETREEYRHYRFELMDESRVVRTVPSPQERDAYEKFVYWLRDYQRRHPNGVVLCCTLSGQELPIGVARRSADGETWVVLGRVLNPVSHVPSVIVEIVSDGRRNVLGDFREKRAEYLSIGVREYWNVDLFVRTPSVVAGSAASPTEREHPADECYTTPRISGFALCVDRLFAPADEWEPTASAGDASAAEVPAASSPAADAPVPPVPSPMGGAEP